MECTRKTKKVVTFSNSSSKYVTLQESLGGRCNFDACVYALPLGNDSHNVI